jgi:hypothetical protein
MIFLEELKCFSFHLREAILHKVDVPQQWKCEWQAVFLSKLSQFSMVNKVLDPLDPNMNDSLTRATGSLSLHMNWVILQKGDVPHSWQHWEVGITPFNSTQLTVISKVIDPLASNIDDSLKRATALLPFTRIWSFCKKVDDHPHKTLPGRQ